ncbi:MAG: hypothetical protein PHF29_05760 [Candidatus Riflebacteria bacterium]|nr:hypothetical protein [Candidatus Riflebacteria bacterium]
MERYNPQSIEKQAKKWPVFTYEEDIYADMRRRLEGGIGLRAYDWIFPEVKTEYFDKEIIDEYGIDACRLSVISTCGNKNTDKNDYLKHLDSTYNWLSRFYEAFTIESSRQFDEKPWLNAIFQAYDHAVLRKKPNLAFALICKAFKDCPPNKALTKNNLELVLSAVYPFLPILSRFLVEKFVVKLGTVNEIFEKSEKFVGVRFRIGEGGWHREIFDKVRYEEAPLVELLRIKWVNAAANKRQATLTSVEGGKQIVFFGQN